MNTIIAAVAGGLSSRGTDSMNVKQGANQVPFSKAINQHVGSVYAIELNPVTKVQIQDQGSTNNFIVVSHYGPCPEAPDGHDMPALTPFSTSQMRDDFDLPIAGGPAPGQAGNMMQLSAGNPVNIGTLSTSPDGVTSPAIPNSGDVTPGTAASNPTAYLTGPVTKQHPWITDVVMDWGLKQTAYGKYDYTDPAGTVHSSLGKGDTKVKKPLLSIKRATNTTALYSGQLVLPGSSPTEYLHSGLRRANDTGGNDGVGVLTKWGTNIDKDDAVDVWLAAAATLPTLGEGAQITSTIPCYDGPVYNRSALGVDGGDSGHALYVKVDGASMTQDDGGGLRSHAITITHSPPIDADVPGTARDGMVVVCTNDNSVWERSSGTWHRLTLPLGGTTGQVLTKINATDYNVDWETPTGGGGGGTLVSISMGDVFVDFPSGTTTPLAFFSDDFTDHGGWVTAGTDDGSAPAGGTTIVFPTTGTYEVTYGIESKNDTGALTGGGRFAVSWQKNGTEIYSQTQYRGSLSDSTSGLPIGYRNPRFVGLRILDVVAGDTFQFVLNASTGPTMHVDGGSIDIHKIA